MLINEIQMDRILILKHCRKNPNLQTLVAANLKIMIQYYVQSSMYAYSATRRNFLTKQSNGKFRYIRYIFYLPLKRKYLLRSIKCLLYHYQWKDYHTFFFDMRRTEARIPFVYLTAVPTE